MTAYEKGQQAEKDGVDWDDNPFKEGSLKFKEWQDGWLDASIKRDWSGKRGVKASPPRFEPPE